MTGPDHGLRKAREQAIDALCSGFARDALTLPELERRLERARSAGSREELRALLTDLTPEARPVAARPGPRAAQAPDHRQGPPAAAADHARASVPTAGAGKPGRPAARRTATEVPTGSHLAFAILGGTRRAGRWAPPAGMVAFAFMGAVELDFRDAVIAPGDVVDINVFALWGGIEITVPPDVHVDSRGFALLGGFDQVAELDSVPAPDAPTIRVNGLAIMGGVEVKVKAKERRP